MLCSLLILKLCFKKKIHSGLLHLLYFIFILNFSLSFFYGDVIDVEHYTT